MRLNQVSVIVPVHNRPALLREAVAAVMAQSYRDIEIVIVDDGSSDDTPAVALALSQANPDIIRVVSQANAGPGAARNLGLTHARGEFIQYLDSDDLLEPRKFEWQVQALRAHPEAGVAYGLTRRVNLATGEARDWACTNEDVVDIFPSFLLKRGWDTNSPLWRRSVCDAIGPWVELRCLEDWEHDLRAGLLGVKPVRVQGHVATVRDHGETRASGMDTGFTPAIVRDMFVAHRSIWRKMQEADKTEWTCLEPFSRKVFWIARLCGERGLEAEADEALELAREIMAIGGSTGRIRAFRAMKQVLGWRWTVRLGETTRGVFRRPGGNR